MVSTQTQRGNFVLSHSNFRLSFDVFWCFKQKKLKTRALFVNLDTWSNCKLFISPFSAPKCLIFEKVYKKTPFLLILSFGCRCTVFDCFFVKINRKGNKTKTKLMTEIVTFKSIFSAYMARNCFNFWQILQKNSVSSHVQFQLAFDTFSVCFFANYLESRTFWGIAEFFGNFILFILLPSSSIYPKFEQS